ncbi:VanZ family protein [Nocardioides sp. CFH 31398]|uniref:VanZ family protein n=1 Tax=Nocardioides sp. CFH 31398 TaxID=2919579 RepID=UPI001F0623A4|nr:VanZ family protein [Nocardioides sp. CFH 31398]MCH1865340.1 VanZ family protein [Nocardioides sp. CFH 31398]
MISTVLVEHSVWVRPGLAVLVALMLVVGALLVRNEARRASALLATVAGVAGLALTAWPEPAAATEGVRCAAQLSVPFQGLDTLANIALFVPATYAAVLACRRPLVVAVAASGLSALIEVVQALVPATGRVCDTNDWFMNTVGAALGVLLGLLTVAVVPPRPRPRRRRPQPEVTATR